MRGAREKRGFAVAATMMPVRGHTVTHMAYGVYHAKLGTKINLSEPDLGHPGLPGLWEQLYGKKISPGELECLGVPGEGSGLSGLVRLGL
jgi:hypothetical protein